MIDRRKMEAFVAAVRALNITVDVVNDSEGRPGRYLTTHRGLDQSWSPLGFADFALTRIADDHKANGRDAEARAALEARRSL